MAQLSDLNVKLKIKLPWWRNLFLALLQFFCFLHQCEPDYDKVSELFVRHTKIKVTHD